MHLKTNIKLGEVNNLADARFGAGIGAGFVGFNFNPESARYIDPEKFKEIAGWLDGPTMVAEWDDQPVEHIQQETDAIGLEYIQLNKFDVTCARALKGFNIIQNIYLDGCHSISEVIGKVDAVQACAKYFMLSFESEEIQNEFLGKHYNEVLLIEFCRDYPVLFNFKFNKDNLLGIIEKYHPFGINLPGGTEEKTGLKDFEGLNGLVELLEA
jgi:phosphoribosylanthranilate isomerase